MASFLDCFFRKGRGCHRSLLGLSFSAVTLQSLISLQKKPFTVNGSKDHGPPHSWQQHGLWVSTWPQESAQVADLSMVSSSADHGDHHGP